MKVETIENQDALRTRLIELSQDGQAWVYSVEPFSHQVAFASFKSPSHVPDQYYDLMASDRRIGYKGKLVPFSNATVVREQNKVVSRD